MQLKVAPTEVHTIIRNYPPQPSKKTRLDILFKKLDDGLRATEVYNSFGVKGMLEMNPR